MSAIAGLLSRSGPPDDTWLTGLADALAGRARGAATLLRDGPVGLIARPHREHQAVSASTADVIILLDGWIAEGSVPGETDVERVIEAWRRHGPGFGAWVEGDFAVAIWERARRTLHLVRDRLGARPMFFARRGAEFAFASDLRPLLDLPWVSRELAREHLSEYLSFRVVHAPRTLARDVEQLRPGHALSVPIDGEPRLTRWWFPEYPPDGTEAPPRPSDVVERLQAAVEAAVLRRLPEGEPAGLYLSGGVGSTAIAAALRARHRRLPTFTVTFADDLHPEAPFAARVARLLGLEHETVVVGTRELAESFTTAVGALGVPIGSPTSMLQLALARATSKQATLVLSGDGGDELFGGRMAAPPTRWLHAARAVAALPAPARSLVRLVSRRSSRLSRLVVPTERWGLELGIGGALVFSDADRESVLADPVWVAPGVRRVVLAPFYEEVRSDPINAVLHASVYSTLVEAELVRADRTGVFVGMETRYPLLDGGVLRLAKSLPGSFKTEGGAGLQNRWLLRALISGVVPEALVKRPDRGLPLPMGAWLAGPGRLFMEERFASLRQNRHRLWNLGGLDALRARLLTDPSAGPQLWCLFVLDTWLDATGVG